jgi:hypothetical protein
MNSIRTLLTPGRTPLSLGRVEEVISIIRTNSRRIAQLIECLYADDPGTANRAADAVEKLTRVDSPLDVRILEKWKAELIELMAEARFNKLKWNLALILPRIKLSRAECRTITQILETQYLEDASSIVKTFALHSLADLTWQNPEMRDEVVEILRIHGRSGTAAMRARSRILLKELERPAARRLPMPGMVSRAKDRIAD